MTYQAKESLRFDLYIPYIDLLIKQKSLATRRSKDGIGDIQVTSAIKLFDHILGEDSLACLVGLKFPTGDYKAAIQEMESIPFIATRLGTGTYDPIAGIIYGIETKGLKLFGSTVARITGGSNDSGYRTGDELSASFGLGHDLSDKITGYISLDGSFRNKDENFGKNVTNSGQSLWKISPSVLYKITDDLTFEINLQYPFYRHVNGEQLAQDEVSFLVSLYLSIGRKP